ncbi:MAG: imidazole glycerol phosphate synthase subunit HisH [Candidatus Omnitrophota bacterium]|nr:imidazole glycerol phosphate synthase subunit HisH [Candidatus Omnitrophota bacterium]
MIGIIDYGAGNLRSVYNAFQYLGQNVCVCTKPDELDYVDKIVLPGVGASKDAMQGLRQNGFIEPLLRNIKEGKDFLGICLGLQLLFNRSFEFGSNECLGLLKGEVKLFKPLNELKVPQIGWNTVKFIGAPCPVFKGIKDNSYFYFVHSYYCDNEESKFTLGETEYGIIYTSAIWKENVYAVQFHPERSQKNGLKILTNFGGL